MRRSYSYKITIRVMTLALAAYASFGSGYLIAVTRILPN